MINVYVMVGYHRTGEAENGLLVSDGAASRTSTDAMINTALPWPPKQTQQQYCPSPLLYPPLPSPPLHPLSSFPFLSSPLLSSLISSFSFLLFPSCLHFSSHFFPYSLPSSSSSPLSGCSYFTLSAVICKSHLIPMIGRGL